MVFEAYPIHYPLGISNLTPIHQKVFRNHQAIWFPDDFRIQSRVSALREAGE